MSDKTPTERLRELLDERGVKYSTEDSVHAKATSWLAVNGKLATFAEYEDGSTTFSMDSLSLTPEQAIAATLGSGTCECDSTIQWLWTGPTTYYEHELSCGHVITSVDEEPPNYCEECGAKVRKAVSA